MYCGENEGIAQESEILLQGFTVFGSEASIISVADDTDRLLPNIQNQLRAAWKPILCFKPVTLQDLLSKQEGKYRINMCLQAPLY